MKKNCTQAEKCSIDSAGVHYEGHWHDNVAVLANRQGDRTAFIAGRGWCGYSESQRLVRNLCGGELIRERPSYSYS